MGDEPEPWTDYADEYPNNPDVLMYARQDDKDKEQVQKDKDKEKEKEKRA